MNVRQETVVNFLRRNYPQGLTAAALKDATETPSTYIYTILKQLQAQKLVYAVNTKGEATLFFADHPDKKKPVEAPVKDDSSRMTFDEFRRIAGFLDVSFESMFELASEDVYVQQTLAYVCKYTLASMKHTLITKGKK